MRRKILVVLALAGALAACGGGSTKSGSTAKQPDTKKSESSAPVAAGGGGGAICDFANSYQEKQKALAPDPSATDPASIKTQMLAAQKAMDEGVKLAPSEIKADITVVAGIYSKMISAMAKYDYDYSKIKPEEAASVFAFAQDGSYLEAAKRISKFFHDKCGIPDPFQS